MAAPVSAEGGGASLTVLKRPICKAIADNIGSYVTTTT